MQPFLPASFHDFSNYIGVRFYAFDYSGYGRSTGKPSEKNIYYDIESVYSGIVKREGDDVMVSLDEQTCNHTCFGIHGRTHNSGDKDVVNFSR